MAMRRPRIKPVANILLNSKRKGKSANDVKSNKVCENNVNSVEVEKSLTSNLTEEENFVDSTDKEVKVIVESSPDTTTNKNNLNNAVGNENNGIGNGNITTKDIENNQNDVDLINNTKEQFSRNSYEGVLETLNDSEAFKCPAEVGFQRTISHASNGGIDDVFYSDIEENALQMDSEKSSLNSCPMSPSKNLARQRIRPTPHFGQRRNSFVGSSPSAHTSGNEDNNPNNNNSNNDLAQTTQTRRERHLSGSFTGNSHSSASLHLHPYKYHPAGVKNSTMGRIRTESACSVFSDSNTSNKWRKTEDQKHRKDFESRFHNRIPEKHTLKMYDLIYYNPVTNPMEKKINPIEKLEQFEIPSKDTKLFAEEVEKEAESDALPVPQLKLNAKGELILDDNSLVIETTAEQEARKVLANSSLIYLDEYTGMNGFYSRRKRTRKWLPSETIKFYRCLQNVGTDFSLMVSLFPNRTRRDLKLKFKKEERKNLHLINKAIVHPKLFDIESLKQQLNEEEKALDQAEADKKKSKKSEKRKDRKDSNVRSKANRVLINGDGVYQNEYDLNLKTVGRTNINRDESDNIAQSEKETAETHSETIETSTSKEVTHIEIEHKLKRKRKRKSFPRKINRYRKIPKKISDDNLNLNKNERNKIDQQMRRQTPNKGQKERIIKEEIIKIENKQESTETSAYSEYQDIKQIQTEIDELLGSDEIDIEYDNAYDERSDADEFIDTSQVEQHNEEMNTVLPTTQEEHCIESDTDIGKYEHTSFVNLIDGSVDIYSSIKDDIVFITSPTTASPSRSLSPHSALQSPIRPIENDNGSSLLKSTAPEIDINNDTCSSVISERELSESDIQSILTELAEGSLVLVSTLDPDDPDKVLNEIYMVDKNTGDLCDEPLSIPDNIVQCILTVVG